MSGSEDEGSGPPPAAKAKSGEEVIPPPGLHKAAKAKGGDEVAPPNSLDKWRPETSSLQRPIVKEQLRLSEFECIDAHYNERWAPSMFYTWLPRVAQDYLVRPIVILPVKHFCPYFCFFYDFRAQFIFYFPRPIYT